MEQLTQIGTYLSTEWLFVLRLIVQIGFSFGVVVFIHELGHFLAAKMAGVAATDFALGMGPEIFGFQWGETRCKLCLFPIGGYVKLVGEEDEDVPPELQARSLRSKSTPAKIWVIFAGPFMNLILAILLNALVLMVWGVPRSLDIGRDDFAPVVVAAFVDPREPAGKAGMKMGDTILGINGIEIKARDQVKQEINRGRGKPVTFTVKRDYRTLTFKVTPKEVKLKTGKTDKIESVWQVGIAMYPPTPRYVKKVAPGSAAAKAGLVPGDVIVDFDMQDFPEKLTYTARHAETRLLVKSAGAKKLKEVTLGAGMVKPGQDIGITLATVNVRLGPLGALKGGVEDSMMLIAGTAIGIKQMITREVSASSVAGPVGIIQYASTFARSGVREFISFFAAISVTLAFINLVPFPALDGSLIVFFLWEGITKRPLDPRKQGIVVTVGFSILISLIVLLTLRDLRLWLGI